MSTQTPVLMVSTTITISTGDQDARMNDRQDESDDNVDAQALTARLNPSHQSRILTVLSFPLLLLVALPFWYYTTSIVRLPLPTGRIQALEGAEYNSPRTTIWLTADTAAFPTPPPGKAVFEHDDVLAALVKEITKAADGFLGQQPAATRAKRLWDIKIGRPQNVKHDHSLRVHIRHTDRANSSLPLRSYIQAEEKGLITSGIQPGTLVISVHPSLMGTQLLMKHYVMTIDKAIRLLFPPHILIPDIPHRALKYSPNVTLSFVLLNEDASLGGHVRNWEIERAIARHITPHLEPLKDIFDFSIESQILHHAPLTFEPISGSLPPPRADPVELLGHRVAEDDDSVKIVKDVLGLPSDNVWKISEEETKIFVNSERWSLDSGSTNNPVLRFLLFVPSALHRPMRIDLPDTSDSFLIPQYGSVAIVNPPPSAPVPVTAYHLPLDALAGSFHLFTQHLYSLLALPSQPSFVGPSLTMSPNVPEDPFIPPVSPWQVEQVLRIRTKENSDEARKTLAGIVRLVKKISEMKVEAGVRDKVLGAVDRLEEMDQATDVREAFILSRDAVALANEAFFDPSMMGLLYFPDEHKFAVYTPLFAPVALPIVVGLIKELLAWRKRRQRGAQTVAIASKKPDTSGSRPDEVVHVAADVVSFDEPRVLRSRRSGAAQ